MGIRLTYAPEAVPPLHEGICESLDIDREIGYYEIPREAGIEAVADELECAVSTASELVRRGEANAVERVPEGGSASQ